MRSSRAAKVTAKFRVCGRQTRSHFGSVPFTHHASAERVCFRGLWVKITAMNSSEFAMLKMSITARLRKEGVATSDILASELDAPHGTVRVALEELSDEEVKVVRRLPFGLWDLTENDEKAA